jgi:hypothetical protein
MRLPMQRRRLRRFRGSPPRGHPGKARRLYSISDLPTPRGVAVGAFRSGVQRRAVETGRMHGALRRIASLRFVGEAGGVCSRGRQMGVGSNALDSSTIARADGARGGASRPAVVTAPRGRLSRDSLNTLRRAISTARRRDARMQGAPRGTRSARQPLGIVKFVPSHAFVPPGFELISIAGGDAGRSDLPAPVGATAEVAIMIGLQLKAVTCRSQRASRVASTAYRHRLSATRGGLLPVDPSTRRAGSHAGSASRCRAATAMSSHFHRSNPEARMTAESRERVSAHTGRRKG